MTRVFELAVLEDQEWALPVREELVLRDLVERDRSSRWEPIEMYLPHADERGRPLGGSDIPWNSASTPVLKERAARVIEPLLGSAGVLLPLRCLECPLWVLNVTLLVDALDEPASELVRFPSSGRIMKARRPVFKPEVVSGLTLFKLGPMPRGSVYFTDAAADAITAANLERVSLKQVWEG